MQDIVVKKREYSVKHIYTPVKVFFLSVNDSFGPSVCHLILVFLKFKKQVHESSNTKG
jgi:hypothetical protein